MMKKYENHWSMSSLLFGLLPHVAAIFRSSRSAAWRQTERRSRYHLGGVGQLCVDWSWIFGSTHLLVDHLLEFALSFLFPLLLLGREARLALRYALFGCRQILNFLFWSWFRLRCLLIVLPNVFRFILRLILRLVFRLVAVVARLIVGLVDGGERQQW